MDPLSAGNEKLASFASRERQRQTAYFKSNFPDEIGFRGMAFCLNPNVKTLNLAPSIRTVAIRYFSDKKIAWHRYSNHALSSQVCCLNFLMPLAENPEAISRIVSLALQIAEPEMVPFESGPDGRPWFVGFEWNGRKDYLNEGGKTGRLTRGANSTSADAVVRFRSDGVAHTLLIEWKYTESYGSSIPSKGNPTRIKRYQNLAFAPDGPLRDDFALRLEDFFYEPFYQLLRQQMLAHQMRKATEDGTDRVRVLHIAPSANLALAKVTSQALTCFGANAFEVFRSLLRDPSDFVSRSTEDLFGPLAAESEDATEWASYLARRYAFLADRLAT
jgi:hypothetical protein